MTALLISAVSAGSQLSTGSPSVVNAAKGIATISINSLKVGNVRVGFDVPAVALTFNFVQNIGSPVAAVRFTFGGGQLQPSMTVGNQSAVGSPSIVNVAQGFFAKGIASQSKPSVPIIHRSQYGYPKRFNLTSNLIFKNASNVAFPFGGQFVVSRATIGNQSSMGVIERISQPHSIRPLGISVVKYGNTRLASSLINGRRVAIDLIQPLSISSSKSLRIDFGTNRPITTATLGNTSLLGLASVLNVAQGAFAQGIDSMRVSTPFVYLPFIRDGQVDLGFNFTRGVQSSLNIPFYFNDAFGLGIIGFDAFVSGMPSVVNNLRVIGVMNGVPIPIAQAGHPTIEKWARLLIPSGWHEERHGTPDIRTTTQYVFAGVGQPSMMFGDDISIIYRNVYVRLMGLTASLYGTSRVEHYRRSILVDSMAAPAIGAQQIEYKTRTVAPISIYQVFPSNHLVGGTQTVVVFGFDATSFGARIIPENMTLYASGFVGEFGDTAIKNRRALVRPIGFSTGGQQSADRWGMATTYNLRQYIQMYYDFSSELNPPVWSIWTAITNRSRVVATFGQDAAKVSEPIVFNNARLIHTSGIDAPMDAPFYKTGMVSYRIRTLPLQGIESPYFATWNRIHNDARVLVTSGEVLTTFGTASLVKTRRYFGNIGGFESLLFGDSMVADRIRTLTFESRYGIVPPQITLPDVKLQTRYVDGIGHDLSRYGSASLSIHFNRISTRWTLQNHFGSPEFRNNTPEVHTHGRNAEEYGDTLVRLEWRPVDAFGESMQVFGRTEIAYRDRTRFLTGFNAGRVGDKLIISKTGAPPYTTQNIILSAEEDGDASHGIPAIKPQFGTAILNQTVIYVHQAFLSTVFGMPSIMANTIRVEPGYQELLVGSPRVSLKIRRISVSGWKDSAEPPKARLSPHTIWAVMDATAQARINNPASGGLHYVNSDRGQRAAGEVFGVTTLTLQHRKVKTEGIHPSIVGQAALDLKKRIIYVDGIRSYRFGWHSLPIELIVEQFSSSETMDFGNANVHRPPYLGPRTINPTGLSSFAAGLTRIELFNRTITSVGFNSMAMGARKTGDTPYTWQGLRVGELVPTIPNGFNAAVFGLTWISNRIRGIETVGFDGFLNEYQLEAFDKRMRVTRREIPRVPRVIAPIGISSFISGTPNVKAGTYYIRPDGNSDQYRKGAF